MGALRQRLRDAVPARSRRAVLLATLLFGSVGSYLAVSRLLLGTVEVEGASMEPGLRSGQRCLVRRKAESHAR